MLVFARNQGKREGGFTAAREIQVKNLRIMEIWPNAKPSDNGIRTLDYFLNVVCVHRRILGHVEPLV